MIEIEFRAKAMSAEWVYGNFIHSKRFAGCSNEFRIHNQETGLESDIIPETLGQFTGETDIDSVKIYNSDIIEFEYRGQTFRREVFFEDACYYVEFYPGNDFNPERHRLGYVTKNIGVKVIGNAYDNPELLEGNYETFGK